MPPLDLDFEQGIKNCVESTIQPGSHKEITRVHTHNTLHVSSRDTSAPYSPSMLSLQTALVRRGFITKDPSVCSVYNELQFLQLIYEDWEKIQILSGAPWGRR